MPYIHQLTDWPHFTWSGDALAARLGEVRNKQGRLLGRMEETGFGLRAQSGLAALTQDAVKSWAIEGEKLNPDEVRSSIARRLGLDSAGLPVGGRTVEGVVEVLLDATQHAFKPLTQERLFRWHAELFPAGRSHDRRITVGDWRTAESGPMQVISGPIGKERIHFEAPEASRLPAEMARFLDWFNGIAPIDPVLKAGVAHLWFLTIHPFEDGNGRLARIIADMALCRADGTEQRFYSTSSQIESERSAYYLRLEAAQRGGLDVTVWLDWFLGCLERAIDRALSSLDEAQGRGALWQRLSAHSVNERQRRVLNRMTDAFEGHLTTSKYAKLAKCSTDTALRDITELVEWGALTRNASKGRSTSYQLAPLPPSGAQSPGVG